MKLNINIVIQPDQIPLKIAVGDSSLNGVQTKQAIGFEPERGPETVVPGPITTTLFSDSTVEMVIQFKGRMVTRHSSHCSRTKKGKVAIHF